MGLSRLEIKLADQVDVLPRIGRNHAEGDQTFTVLERWAFLTLKDLLLKELRDHRAAFEKEIHELRARMGDVQTAAHKVRSAAEQLVSFRKHLILWSHLITFTGGALGTLLLLLAFKK